MLHWVNQQRRILICHVVKILPVPGTGGCHVFDVTQFTIGHVYHISLLSDNCTRDFLFERMSVVTLSYSAILEKGIIVFHCLYRFPLFAIATVIINTGSLENNALHNFCFSCSSCPHRAVKCFLCTSKSCRKAQHFYEFVWKFGRCI